MNYKFKILLVFHLMFNKNIFIESFLLAYE
jgi:hypothetical protein